MSRKTLFTVLLGCLLLVWLSGCSTVWTVASGVRKPYSGTAIDTYIIGSADASTLESMCAFLDLPFSIVGDTLVVPFMSPQGIEQIVNPSYH